MREVGSRGGRRREEGEVWFTRRRGSLGNIIKVQEGKEGSVGKI